MSEVAGGLAPVEEAPPRTLFSSWARLSLLEHVRIPHELDPPLGRHDVGGLRVAGSGPSLLCSVAQPQAPIAAAAVAGAARATRIPLFARVLPERMAEPLLARCGGAWRRAGEVTAADGAALSAKPQNGGCCTWLSFFTGEFVELPLTLPQDHTLFVIVRHADEAAWVEKTFLRAHGGMALIDTHPDYLVDDRIFGAYARFLDRVAPDPSAWQALPREASAWWHDRAASTSHRDGDSWRIVGPVPGAGQVELRGGTW